MTKIPEQEKYNSFLLEILGERLFESGKELNRLLAEKFSISDSNARKIVSRASASDTIKSSKPYTFGNRQYVYLLPDVELTSSRIKTICQKHRPPIYRLMNYMDNNGGIVSYYEALKLTASPEETSSTKVQSLRDIIKILTKMNIVYEKADSNNVNYILNKADGAALPETMELSLMNQQYSKMVLDCSFIPDILKWLYNTNIIGTSQNIYRNKKTPSVGAKHNNLLWDAFGYTKATGINPTVAVKADTLEKQTLVVLDVVLATEYSQDNLDGFLSRVQINKHSVIQHNRKILPIIIYKECSDLVLNKIGKLGFIAFDIGSIFGTRIYSVIQELNEINNLSNVDNIDEAVESILNTIRESGQEDALKDLKGVLFEALMYPILSHLYPNASMERGRTLSMQLDGKKVYYEYDYIIDSSNPAEVVIVELKGYTSASVINLGDANTKATLKWFFRKTFPFAQQYIKESMFIQKPIKATFITSANFWDDGKAFIEQMNKSKLKPSKLNAGYAHNDLLELLEASGFNKEKDIIKKFYVKND
ncbi:hypothetical protein [Taibaiella koreensis]|uniref:hypothetical protein n=1 Tax=Taibaiella koreensis TaxID=1268548 RepID=UPI000E59914E|nr:hypothetical protein [Taibaiella koreensis]